MCGITGLWCANSVPEDTALGWIHQMTAILAHRGPDASGSFFDKKLGVGFGHRRLSILDLSEHGRQPMWSQSGRHCITYNGEVYNAPEIRAELEAEGHRIAWRGHSDTEVVLEAIEALGLEPALDRFNGMFAFALWDRETKRLRLVRDRIGIKPLLYVQGEFGLAFASELTALFALPTFRPRLDRGTLASFFRYGVVPGNECIVRGVQKVQPGTVVEFRGPRSEGLPTRFWSVADVAAEGLRQPFQGSTGEAIDELERRIARSVRLRMRSDVPFGAFLSGGTDSSTVVSLMQLQSGSSSVKTFCIGNTLPGYDESSQAEAVAKHLGCEHHALFANPGDMLEIVPEAAGFWDEPFADSSQIPTLMVSRLTRQHVTVSLSGDGGDELFAGYNRHAWAPRLWQIANRLPKTARQALRALGWVQVHDWDRAINAIGLGGAVRLPGDKLHKVAALAYADSPEEFYESLRSHWIEPEKLVRDTATRCAPNGFDSLKGPFSAQMMLDDMTQYLPDDILTKVDRASMSVSLEARVPLLDHDVVEFAWTLPLSWKIQGATQKWILRQVLVRHVPPSLIDRPKMGFGVPIGDFLRGPLKSWATDLLEQKALRADNIIEPRVVALAWDAHQAGRGNHQNQLWTVLMFQSWWRRNRSKIEA